VTGPSLRLVTTERRGRYTIRVSGRRTWVTALLLAIAICVDLAGFDCQRLTTFAASSDTHACGGPGPSGTQAGPDCLCCSTVDLASPQAIAGRAAGGTEFVHPPTADPAAGNLDRLYRPPLS
jgi:hypothetical protein